jgi:serine protease Do
MPRFIEEHRMRNRWSLFCLCAGLAFSLGAAAVAERQDDEDAAALARRRTPVVEVFENSRDAVVNISSTQIVQVRNPFGLEGMFDDFFDRSPAQQYKVNSVGSGFVIHPDGYIVTNAHVVNRTAERKAIFADGRGYDAQLVAIDPERDLAVLKIDAERPLKTLRLARGDDLMIGETVIAIGNPLGYQHTVTAGVVSAVDRELDLGRGRRMEHLVQTDASINPGNSGGPLLNVLGELIGVNTAIRGDAQNIGFAIPVDQLRAVLPEMLDVERRYRIDSGLKLSNLPGRVRVESVAAQSPAARAGIEPGDELTEIAGRPAREAVDFSIALIGLKAGDGIDVSLRRDDAPIRTRLQLAGRPAPDGAALIKQLLGMEVRPLPEDTARQLRLPGSAGLLITDIEADSPASQQGFQQRDIVVAVGRHNATTLEELGQILDRVKSGDIVTVSILRVERGEVYLLRGQVQAR